MYHRLALFICMTFVFATPNADALKKKECVKVKLKCLKHDREVYCAIPYEQTRKECQRQLVLCEKVRRKSDCLQTITFGSSAPKKMCTKWKKGPCKKWIKLGGKRFCRSSGPPTCKTYVRRRTGFKYCKKWKFKGCKKYGGFRCQNIKKKNYCRQRSMDCVKGYRRQGCVKWKWLKCLKFKKGSKKKKCIRWSGYKYN